MSQRPKIQTRYESMMREASSASLPFFSEAPTEVVRPHQRRVIVRPPTPRPDPNEPGEMTKVVFGSLAPNVQPALRWLGTHNGKKVVATGSVALGVFVITRLLSP
jgi:hypothetical protein